MSEAVVSSKLPSTCQYALACISRKGIRRTSHCKDLQKIAEKLSRSVYELSLGHFIRLQPVCGNLYIFNALGLIGCFFRNDMNLIR